MKSDVIVVGAGYAGLIAAWRAAESGARVVLLAKGVGTTHWTPGAIDALGYHPLGTSETVAAPAAAIEKLIAAEPDHPYARVGLDPLGAAMDAVRSVAATWGLTYEGSLETNFLLPTPAGALKPTCLAPTSMVAGDARRSGSMLILGFTKLRDFYPALIAANLSDQGTTARGVQLDIPEISRHRTMTPVILARMLDDSRIRRELIRHAKAAHEREERVGFPAVLGFERSPEVTAELEQALGVPVFEIPTLPPSVPGFRLYEAFRQALQARGSRLLVGSEVQRAETTEGRVVAVETEAAARRVRHTAEKFILATGGIAGGGITTTYKGRVREVVLDLPLVAPNGRAEWFDARFLAPAGQPIFRAGVRVNDQLQPIDEAGAVVYENLRAAGALLAHWDGWREKSHEGVSVATGWFAASTLA